MAISKCSRNCRHIPCFEYFKISTYKVFQNNLFARQYPFVRARVTPGSHLLQRPIRDLAMLLFYHLMTQNDAHADFFNNKNK